MGVCAAGGSIHAGLDAVNSLCHFATLPLCQTCVLRSTIHPTRELLRLERDLLPHGTIFSALHVRLGDGNLAMNAVDGQNSSWAWVREQRHSRFRQNPQAALVCFRDMGRRRTDACILMKWHVPCELLRAGTLSTARMLQVG